MRSLAQRVAGFPQYRLLDPAAKWQNSIAQTCGASILEGAALCVPRIARFSRLALLDAAVPRPDPRQLFLEQMAERRAESRRDAEKPDHGVEGDVSEGVAVAANPLIVAHQAVEPLELVLDHGHLLLRRGVRRAEAVVAALREEFLPGAPAEGVHHRDRDLLLDTPLPHAGLCALRRRAADERALGHLIQQLADRHRLGDEDAALELDEGNAASGVHLEVLRVPIL